MERDLSASWIFTVVEILILASLLVLLPGRASVRQTSAQVPPEVEAATVSTLSGQFTAESTQ